MANRDLTPWGRGGLTPLGRDPFSAFRQEMDRLFEDFLSPGEARSFAQPGAAALRPSVDLEETEDAYLVTAELPGIAEEDIELELKENVLIIGGEKRSEHREENGGRRYTERSFGRFQRAIPFEREVDPEKVEAACRNGVLTVTLPKDRRAQDRSRRIQIGGRQDGQQGQRQAKSQGRGQSGEASAASGSGQ